MTDPIYQKFLGMWVLDVESCVFEQGDPPTSGSIKILADGEELVFEMKWIALDGESHFASFRAKPDGGLIPFDGGGLADALSVTAVSDRELNSSAFRDGFELMSARRKLSADALKMHVVQTVRLPDGLTPSNHSVYHKEQ